MRIYKRKGSPYYWLDYVAASGERVRVSTKCERKKDAEAVALEHQNARAAQEPPPSKRDALMYEDLETLVREYYIEEGQDVDRLEVSLRHLRSTFAGWKAPAITTPRLREYRKARRKAGAARSTVNSELSALRKAMKLAHENGELDSIPSVPRYGKLENARTRKPTELEMARILVELPPGRAALVEAAGITGWRMRSELQTREWRHVDLEGGWLRLEHGEGKTGQPRAFPLTGRMREIIEIQLEKKREIERQTGQVIRHVFFYHEGRRVGRQIKSIRRAWQIAVEAAGAPDLTPHDLRRLAVTRLLSAGLSTTLCMKFTGHKSDVFERYAVMDLVQMQEAAEQYDQYLASTRSAPDRSINGTISAQSGHEEAENVA